MLMLHSLLVRFSFALEVENLLAKVCKIN